MTGLSTALLTSALALLALAAPARATVLFTEDFTIYTGGSGGAPSQLADSGAGYSVLASWATGPGSSGLLGFLFASGSADTTGSHDVRFNDTFLLWGPGAGGGGVANGLTASSPNGGNFIALDSDSTLRGVGISHQLAGLTPGAYYTVSFWWAAAQQHGFTGPTTEAVQVSFGSQTQTTNTFSLASHAFSGWMSQSFTFSAQTATDTLNFLSLGGPNGVPPFVLLDGITVSTAIPEPATGGLVLSVLGLVGGVTFLKWKRRSRGRTA